MHFAGHSNTFCHVTQHHTKCGTTMPPYYTVIWGLTRHVTQHHTSCGTTKQNTSRSSNYLVNDDKHAIWYMIARRVIRSEIGKTRYIQAKTRRTNPETCDSHTISYIITRRVIRSEIGKQATFKQKQERIPETWFMATHTPYRTSSHAVWFDRKKK